MASQDDPGPRTRMIVSTALLIRERGARATSLDAILAHSHAPRGSFYHHFPGGRDQLLREATAYAGEQVARRIENSAGEGPLAAAEALFDEYCATLRATDFRAGCPVVAVAVESGQEEPDLRDAALAAFDRWRRLLASGLAAAGIDEPRADQLGLLIVSAFEGAVILSRAYRDLAPLENVRREIRQRVERELASATADR